MLRAVLLSAQRQGAKCVAEGIAAVQQAARQGSAAAAALHDGRLSQPAVATEGALAWPGAAPRDPAQGESLTGPSLVLMGAPKKRVSALLASYGDTTRAGPARAPDMMPLKCQGRSRLRHPAIPRTPPCGAGVSREEAVARHT